jgi:hypothetical protein
LGEEMAALWPLYLDAAAGNARATWWDGSHLL